MADEEKNFLWRLFFAETGAEVTVIENKTSGLLGEGCFDER